MAFLAAPKSPYAGAAAATAAMYPPPLAGLYAVASEAEDHTRCSPENCSLAAAAAPLALAPPPRVMRMTASLAPSGLAAAPASIPDHSNCGRECSILQDLQPTDPLYRELMGPALRNEALRFKQHVDKHLVAKRVAALSGVSAEVDDGIYDGYFAPEPRTAADYSRQSHTIIHYLKTCGRFDEVEAGPVSMLEDPEYPDAVYFIHFRDPLYDNETYDIYFFPNKTFTDCPEFMRTVFQTWLDGCRVDTNFMEVRYSLRPV